MTEVPDARSDWGRFAPDSVERRMLDDTGTALGLVLRPRTVVLDRARVEVEGIDADDRVVVQLVANQGAYKPAWRNKVMADLFKLLWLRQSVPGSSGPSSSSPSRLHGRSPGGSRWPPRTSASRCSSGTGTRRHRRGVDTARPFTRSQHMWPDSVTRAS